MRSNKPRLFLLILSIIILSVLPVQAVPPLPAEYFGNVLIDGVPAPVGTTITAFIHDTSKGSIVTDIEGFFGGPGLFDPRLKVNVSESEFQTGNLVVSFQINGVPASQSILFEPGASQQLDLYTGELTGEISVPVYTPVPVQTGSPLSAIQSDDGYSETIKTGFSGSEPSIQYGLERDEQFNSDDGMAAISFNENTLLFSPSGQFLQQVFITSRSISDLAPVSANQSLTFSGYAYEITPERTYFNPEGVISIYIPFERISDIMALNPQIYKYLPQTATWEQVRTRSNHFTGEISGTIHEAAVYAMFLENQTAFTELIETTPIGTSSLPPIASEPPVPEYPSYSPPEQAPFGSESFSPPGSSAGYEPYEPEQDGLREEDVPEIAETMQQVTEIANDPQESDIIKQEPKQFTLPAKIFEDLKKILSGPVGIVLGLVLLIIIINAIVYAIYTWWWLVRKS